MSKFENSKKEDKETNQRGSTQETVKLPKPSIEDFNGDPSNGENFSIHLKLQFIIQKLQNVIQREEV